MQHKKIPVHTSYEHTDALPGSAWRKWGIAGVTKIPAGLDKMTIVVEHKTARANNNKIAMLARKHELGHADTVQDILDASSSVAEAFDIVKNGYDRWQLEVEAWIRGCEDDKAFNRIIHHEGQFTCGTFILDCLNSYRRGLEISESDWRDGRTAVVEALFSVEWIKAALYEYEPLEPDQEEDPQTGCFGDENGIPFIRLPAQPEEDGDEKDDAPQPEPGEFSQEEDHFEYEPGQKMNDVWNNQEVLDYIASGHGLQNTGRKYNLDPMQASPLAKAYARKYEKEA